MESLRENRALLYSLLVSGTVIAALASGLLPDVSKHFELVEFETEVICLSFYRDIFQYNF